MLWSVSKTFSAVPMIDPSKPLNESYSISYPI